MLVSVRAASSAEGSPQAQLAQMTIHTHWVKHGCMRTHKNISLHVPACARGDAQIRFTQADTYTRTYTRARAHTEPHPHRHAHKRTGRNNRTHTDTHMHRHTRKERNTHLHKQTQACAQIMSATFQQRGTAGLPQASRIYRLASKRSFYHAQRAGAPAPELPHPCVHARAHTC
jgi:hypothetical protein